MGKYKDFFLRWGASMILLPIMIYYIVNGGKFTFIDFVNLLIHEGGHGIFRIFGDFIYTLGGSLMQIIIPGMFVVFYFLRRERVLTQIFLVWLGENLMNISVYVADARARALPLLGGNKVYHDWNYLLSRMNMLEYDKVLGHIIFYSGIVIFIIAFFAPLIMNNKREEHVQMDLEL